MKVRDRDDDGLPEDLREWPTTNLADLHKFYERRMSWAKSHGEPKMPILRELRDRSREMQAAAREGAA